MDRVTKVFNYNGTPISFLSGNSAMINATEMARCFNKRTVDWLQNLQTSAFLNALSKVRNVTLADLVEVNRGGSNPGTWMHEDVAIEFARWLNPEFAIWCNDRIKELMKFGITATQPTIESIISDPESGILLLQALKKEREEKALLAKENESKRILIEQNQPKVNFATAVENSSTLILIRDLAKILNQNGYNTGEIRLFETLRRDGYLTLSNMPTQRSMDLRVMRVIENAISTPSGSTIKTTTKITGKGQIYFCNRYTGHEPNEGTLIM